MSLLDDYDMETVLQPENNGLENTVESRDERDDERHDYRSDAEVDALGVDEEVNVRARKLRAKLDETRLLSQKALPSLKSNVLKNVKFKGKGHELRDLDRLLEQYQIWAHQVFPKARFDDFIYMARSKSSSGQIRIWRKDQIAKEIEQKRSEDERTTESIDDEPLFETELETEQLVINMTRQTEPDGPSSPVSRFANAESLFVGDSDDDIYDETPTNQPALSIPIEDDFEQQTIQAYEELGF